MYDQKPKEKTAIIDFNGTLCKFAFPMVGPPEPGVREALETLKKAGYTIKIHSCRTANYWGRPTEREAHIDLIFDFLNDHYIPFDDVILSPTMDKPIADAYIDDRAIRYENNWLEIARRLTT